MANTNVIQGGSSTVNIPDDSIPDIDDTGVNKAYKELYEALQSGNITSAEFQRLTAELSVQMATTSYLTNDRVEKEEKSMLKRAREMVFSPTESVSPEKAQNSLRAVLNNKNINLAKVEKAPLELMMLMAANLGIKTFSNSADAMSKSMATNTETQKKVMDQKMVEYEDQVKKQQEEAAKAKKKNIIAKIFAPFKAIMKVFQPLIDLIKKIPGVKQAIEFISKNVSKIALPLAIVASILCPMSLPVTLGLLAGTAAATGFKIADEVMGKKAPAWLDIAGTVSDVALNLSMAISCGGMASGALAKIGGKISSSLEGTMFDLSKLSGKVSSFIGNEGASAMKSVLKWSQAVENTAESARNVSEGAINYQKAALDRDIANFSVLMDSDDANVTNLKGQQKQTASRLESIINQNVKMLEGTTSSMTDMNRLRSRIANSLA